MNETSEKPTHSAAQLPESPKIADFGGHRQRKQRREAEKLFKAFEAAVWAHLREMVERASDKPRRPRPTLVVDSDATGEPRQGRCQHVRQIDT